MRSMKKEKNLRSLWKKVLCVGLTVTMVLPLTACGGRKSTGTGNSIDLKEMTYRMDPAEMNGIEGDVSRVFSQFGKIYAETSSYEDLTEYPADWVDGNPPDDAPDDIWDTIEYKSKNTNSLYLLDMDKGEAKELISVEMGSEDSKTLYNFAVGPDGTSYALFGMYNESTESNEYEVAIYDETGQKTGGFSMTDFFKPEDNPYVNSMVVDAKGIIYFSMDQEVLAVDKEAKELFRITVKNWIGSLTNDRDGNAICLVSEEVGYSMNRIDPAKKGFSDKVTVNGNINNPVAGNGSWDFYFNDGNGIVGMTLDGKNQTILNWIGSNIDGQYMQSFASIGDDKFLSVYYNYTIETGDSEESGIGLMLLTKVDPSTVANKVALTYGGIWLSDDIRTAAIKFNKSQDKYQIIIKDYSGEDDPAAKFNADLLAGNVPDIMDLSNVPVEKYIAKGMLVDLNALIEKDPELKKEDFIDNIITTMEKDGKLYYISNSFCLQLMVGYQEDVQGKKSLQVKDIIELEKKYPGSRAFSQWSSNTSVLTTLCQNNYDNYIDWATGKCSFDSQEFVDTLEYAATYPNEDDINYEDEVDTVKEIRNHKQLFTEIWNIAMEEFELYNEVYDNKAAFMGYPSPSEGVGLNLDNMVGIYSKSASVDGCWEFLRTLLTRDYISGKISRQEFYNFPLRKDSLEDLFKRYTATSKYKDDFGNEVEPVNGSWGFYSMDVEIKPMTEDQIQTVRDTIAAVNHNSGYDANINNIITEEAGALFSGQKSAKEVAGIIQNRVNTYVNENR
ncbi:MAG: hypothetical protein IK078_00900 [Lachnospiraceae bacterium]|nr:hypothetical protein [Lachnospiraceae bacterium]